MPRLATVALSSKCDRLDRTKPDASAYMPWLLAHRTSWRPCREYHGVLVLCPAGIVLLAQAHLLFFA